jgi:hypothetical protein
MRSKLFERLADNTDPDSFASRLRRRRTEIFVREVDRVTQRTEKEGPVRILDLGGTLGFWRVVGLLGDDRYEITTVNIDGEPFQESNVVGVIGDATNLSDFGDRSFDVAFSNSAIEHVGAERQQAMVEEMYRTAERLVFLQTPCRGFPIEPHFHFPWFGLIPFEGRVWLVQHLALGWGHQRQVGREAAVERVRGVELLSRRRLMALFAPSARLEHERVLGWAKSFIVIDEPAAGSRGGSPG